MPRKECLELKSLKEYLFHYRNLGIFQENIVNQVLNDVVKATDPRLGHRQGRFPPPRRHLHHRDRNLSSTRQSSPAACLSSNELSSFAKRRICFQSLPEAAACLLFSPEMASATETSPQAPAPSIAGATIALTLLTALNFVNYIDRYILARRPGADQERVQRLRRADRLARLLVPARPTCAPRRSPAGSATTSRASP